MVDILLLVLFPLLAVILTLFLHANFLVSIIFFFGFPSIYLSYRTKNGVLRALIFSLCFLAGGIFFDHLAVLDNAWHVPTIFPFRVFGTVPIEDVVWALLLTYFIVIFYEHFFDKGKHKLINPHMKYLGYVLVSVVTFLLFSIALSATWLQISYFYLKGGLVVMLLPVGAFLIKFSKFLGIFLKTAPYFFYVGFLQEVTALQLGHWSFPGVHSIGWVTIFGYRFPYEELFFFLILNAVAVITYFAFFDDTRSHISRKRK